MDYSKWFMEMANKLSPEVKARLDEGIDYIKGYGLMEEVEEWTFRNYKDIEGADNSHDEKFMRAVSWAMDEWDL